MPVTETSLFSYAEIITKLGPKHKEILYWLKRAKRPVSDQELSIKLGWPINAVTPRRNELQYRFITPKIQHVGFKINKIGRKVRTYGIWGKFKKEF